LHKEVNAGKLGHVVALHLSSSLTSTAEEAVFVE
jgi:hypothetical protein